MNSSYINHFTQPDTIIPDYTNPQSWNRYSYVGNNPIMRNDPTGHMQDEGGHGGCDTYAECGIIYIPEPRSHSSTKSRNPDQNRPSTVFCEENYGCWNDGVTDFSRTLDLGDGTIQFGIGINGFKGPGIRSDLALAIDFKGNLAILWTKGGGGYLGIGGGGGPYMAVTNAPSVDFLKGLNVQVGAQFGEGETVGAEYIIFRGADRNRYSGISISDKVQIKDPWPPFEVHVTGTHTNIIWSVNLAEISNDFSVYLFGN